jgi:hypothetical protein
LVAVFIGDTLELRATSVTNNFGPGLAVALLGIVLRKEREVGTAATAVGPDLR